MAELTRRGVLLELTPLEYVADWISDGGSLSSLARDMKANGCEYASQSLLSRVVHSLDGAVGLLAAARKTGAASLVDQAQEILENCGADKDEIALAKAQADIRLWQAERLDKTHWGINDGKGINVNVNVGDLHLEALMQRNAMRKELPPAPIPEAEYEVVEKDGFEDIREGFEHGGM